MDNLHDNLTTFFFWGGGVLYGQHMVNDNLTTFLGGGCVAIWTAYGK